MQSPPEFWRSPRLKRALPNQEITIPDPPPAPSPNNTALWISLLPVGLMAVVMVGVGLVSGATTMLMFSVPMILASGVASAIIYQTQKRSSARQAADRLERYRALLQDYEGMLQRLGEEQRAQRLANDPSPAECLQWVQARQRTLWARTPGDDDFLCVRLGIGQLPSTVTVKTPAVQDVLNPDPLVTEAQSLARRHADINGVPICLDLRSAGVTGIGGERSEAVAAAHAMVIQLVTHHAPSEVKLAAIFPASELAEWEWMRWLPHTWRSDRSHRLLAATDRRHLDEPDTVDPVRRVLAELDHLLDMRRRMVTDSHSSNPIQFGEQWIVLLADPFALERNPVVYRLEQEGAELGVFPVFMGGRTKELPAGCRAVVKVGNGSGSLIRPGVSASQQLFAADRVDATLIDTFALAMAPLRLKQLAGRTIPTSVSLLELLRVERVEELPIEKNWRASTTAGRSLVAPIGLGIGGERLLLDLHERADGPNGLVAGMVGAGKSELLQTLVASLAVHFHPERLAFVLVDFKGGSMATLFKDLPHTLGVITNLQEESLALRAITSFRVELKRREQLLEDAGVNHIDDYQRKYYNGELKTPLPYLVVIVDEFAEMKTEQPETAKEFVRIARVGRALGLRLILAMQKPAGIVDGQIEANTRFRLCLRVAQTEDSQAMLKCPDAAYLNGMGRAFLQVGANEKFQEFQVAYGGAAYDPQRALAGDPLEVTYVSLDGSRQVYFAPGRTTGVKEQTQLAALVARLQQVAGENMIQRTAELWQEPLASSIALETIRTNGGWNGETWSPASTWLTPVVGLVDEPQVKRQRPLELNLGKEGHLAIYSAPGYGKTTFLQTLITSLALTYSPADVSIYILDFGSRMLKLFESLPHVGAVIAADEGERVERMLLLLQRKLDERRQLFGAVSASSLPVYRKITGSDEPAIVVVVDNFANLMDAFGDDEAPLDLIGRLAREGGNLGIHLVLTANNTTTIRFSVTSNIMLAVALHLVEASEASSIVGRFENLKPAALPGRGLLRGNPPLECQIALPVKAETDAERALAMRNLMMKLNQSWQGKRPMPVKILPEVVTLHEAQQADLPKNTGRSSTPSQSPTDSVPATIGLHVDDLTRFSTMLRDGPHFLIAGPSRSGKSTLLRTWAFSLVQEAGDGVRLYVVDSLRRNLEGLCNLPQVAAYSSTPEQTDSVLAAVEADLRSGLALRSGNGNASAGKEFSRVVLVDDFGDNYDGRLSDEQRNQLASLMRFGRNRPFHLLIAGRTTDLSNLAYHEPIRTLKEAQVGLMLGSGDDTFFNTRLPYHERTKMLPLGEAYYINRTYVRRIKVAVPDVEQEPAPL